MTPEKREELKRLADEAGVTVQAYMDRAVFPEDTHVHDTTRERGLPMTG